MLYKELPRAVEKYSLKKKINPPIISILKKNNQQKYNKKSLKL
jgi:hypothetical protein